MAKLFDKDTDTISMLLKNIYASGELEEDSTTEYSSVVRKDVKLQVRRIIKHYNLDAIINVGYPIDNKWS